MILATDLVDHLKGCAWSFHSEMNCMMDSFIASFEEKSAKRNRFLEDTEPLLDLIHPGAVYWSEMELKARMALEPPPHLFSMVHTHIVTDNVDQRYGGRGLSIDVLEKRDEFFLPFSRKALADHFSCSGIECGKEV